MAGNNFFAGPGIPGRGRTQVSGLRRASLLCFALILSVHVCVLEIYANFSRSFRREQTQRRETLIAFEFDAKQAPAAEEPLLPAAEKPPRPAAKPAEAAPAAAVEKAEEPAAEALEDAGVLTNQAGYADENAAAPVYSAFAFGGEGPGDAVSGRKDYLALVLSLLEANKIYPHSARKRGLEGEVALNFVIERDGRAGKVNASGAHAFLVDAAKASVRRASPFPPPEDDFFEASVTISYRLE
ncbi:MAG: energy transducer TonB [Treponema sp.]|jgi:protein TonB|nr:energy transducer TonB [Treponema sp.]